MPRFGWASTPTVDRAQRLARKAEQKTAELHQGRVTPGSGSGRAIKNDVRNAEWSYEVKSTSQQRFGLARALLETAERHAMSDGRRMAFVVDFLPPPSLPGSGARYITTTEHDFIERENELARLREELTEVTGLWSAERSALKDELREAEWYIAQLKENGYS
jgi:hypothetical protein